MPGDQDVEITHIFGPDSTESEELCLCPTTGNICGSGNSAGVICSRNFCEYICVKLMLLLCTFYD